MKFASLTMFSAAVARRAAFVLTLAAATAQFAAADEFWITDRANDRVIALDAGSGRFLRVIANTGMSQPTSLTEGPGGQIFVTNGSLGDPLDPVPPVVVVDPNGALGSNVTEFDVGNATSAGAPLLPGGILYDSATSSILVSELAQFDGSRVFRFSLQGGNPIQTIGEGSPSTGRTGLAIENGQLYVSEFGQFLPELNNAPLGSVTRDSAGALLPFARGFTSQQVPVLLGAGGLDFDAQGSIYVASLIGQGIVKYPVSEGVAGDGSPYGQPLAYPSGILVTEQGGRESLLATSLGNSNPQDPIYMGFLFPGGIVRYDLATGNQVSFLVGDFNGDQVVNDADFAVSFVASFGSTAGSDANGDGRSGGDDFLAWQRNRGNQGVTGSFQPTAIIRHVAAAPLAAVPEPATISLALLASAFARSVRLRRVSA